MTRIHTNAKPMDFTTGLRPMAREDERFWQLRRGEAKPTLWQRITRRTA